jgi:hypothetical protein
MICRSKSGRKLCLGGLMSRSLIIVASLFPAAALAAQPPVVLDTFQMPNANQSIAAHAPIRLSMGPDPGGKTGATVNSDTSKTGQPSVDGTASSNSSSASNAAGGAERRSAQSQGTTGGSDGSKRGSSTGNSPSDSTDHSQNAPGNLNPSATSR